jgi:hypothetical protein
VLGTWLRTVLCTNKEDIQFLIFQGLLRSLFASIRILFVWSTIITQYHALIVFVPILTSALAENPLPSHYNYGIGMQSVIINTPLCSL